MPTCQVQTGFFVLSPCGRETTRTCDSCGIYCCDRHSVTTPSGTFLCVVCNAKENPHRSGKGKQDKDKYRYDYDDWESNSVAGLYLMREEFYWAESFRPFDESDYAGFDQRESFSGLDDELGEGGFFDS